MSYILDALKKSAEERRRAQRAGPFTADTALLPDRQAAGKLAGLLVVVAGIILLAIGGATAWYWLIAGHTNTDIAASQPELRRGAADSISPQEATPAIVSDANNAAPNRQQTAVTQSAEAPPPTTFHPPADSSPALPPLLQELPSATRAALPELTFSGHVYSPVPALRMIMANASVVRENALIAPDVRLLEITETGVLLDFRGTTFRIELLPPLR